MAYISHYLRRHIPDIVLVVIMNAIMISVYFLYDFPLSSVIYPVILCDLLACIALCIDGYLTYERYRKLTSITNPDVCETSCFPAPLTEVEQLQAQLIEQLRSTLTEHDQAHERTVQDMLDYYTVWAHQIKTPISAMKVHLQNEDTPFSRSLQNDLFHIEQYADMVLAYLRLSSSVSDFRFQKYDIDEIVRRSLRRYADEFIERKLTLHYTPLHMEAITDEKWLGFVIGQVIGNALKYTPSGSVSIYPKQSDTIVIEDTGIGILPEDLPRIFDNGFTGYNGRLSPQATGIGLYLCRQVCTQLNHTITAESTPGNGTKIIIALNQNHLTQM
ncbi:MAG: sensor histidine kinase [Bulleidia sp.]